MYQCTGTFHIVKDPDDPSKGDEAVVQGKVFPDNHPYVTRAPLQFIRLEFDDPTAPASPAAAPAPAPSAQRKGPVK